MLINVILVCFFIISILMILFFLSGKMEKWSFLSSSIFECGFTSYFYSRFSFSIHYFLIGLIFLILDLELCVLMPFLNLISSSLILIFLSIFFVLILLLGLLYEWQEGKLEWVS